MDINERRSYVEGMVEAAGLSPEAAALAIEAAMSASDLESDDDFEMMVDAVIEGADESTR